MTTAFPYPYGTYLHWLWGWGQRIQTFLDLEELPSEHSWMIFRPDQLADEAMLYYSVDYPSVIQELRAKLAQANDAYSEFTFDYCERTESSLAECMDILGARVIKASEIIAAREGITPNPASIKTSAIRSRERDTIGRLISPPGQPANSHARKQARRANKIKPDADTVKIIRAIEREPDNTKAFDALGIGVAKSIANVRKVRSQHKRGMYEL